MTTENEDKLIQIVERAAGDQLFRERLLKDPASVAEEYGVPIEAVEKLTEDSESFSGELDARVSKRKMGRFGGLSGPMGIDGVEE